MRKTTKVTTGVKARLEDLKKHLNVKTESEVIAYLASVYDLKFEKLTVPEHQRCLESMNDLQNQKTL